MPKNQIPQKTKEWTGTYGKHIGCGAVISQEEKTAKFRCGRGCFTFLLRRVSYLACMRIWEGKKLHCNSSLIVIDICTHE